MNPCGYYECHREISLYAQEVEVGSYSCGGHLGILLLTYFAKFRKGRKFRGNRISAPRSYLNSDSLGPGGRFENGVAYERRTAATAFSSGRGGLDAKHNG